MSRLVFQPDPGAVDKFRSRHTQAFERARQEVIGLADRNAPRDHGRLAASITTDGPARRTQQGVEGAFGSAERHAMMREFGGEIRPVRRKALSWISKSGVRIVLGPGIKRKFAKVDKETGQTVIFVPGWGVTQKPGGVSQGNRPYLRPAGAEFSRYMREQLA